MIKVLMALCSAAVAMQARETFQPDLSGLVYPVLAKSARMQGLVKFSVKDGKITLISGHPILVQNAKQNLERWALEIPSSDEFRVNYSFLLTDESTTKIVETEQPIGDAFDRLFLRIFRRSTTRRVPTIERDVLKENENVTSWQAAMADELPLISVMVSTGVPCVMTTVTG